MPDSCDVAIVGAGLSGMTAAYQLRDLDLVVLEAESRIGGRSQRTELAGWPTTSGGEGWYDPNPESPERKLLTELGIECTPVGGPGMLHADGRIVGLASPEQLAEDLGLSEKARPDFVRTFERVQETCDAMSQTPVDKDLLTQLLAVSAVEWIGPVHSEVLAFYRRLAATEQGTSLETQSALIFLHGTPAFGGASDIWMDFLVPDGGAPMISWALMDGLERPPVTGALVTAVEQSETGCTISYRRKGEQKTLDARFAIVATPPPVTSEIVRGLPSAKLAAIAKIAVVPIVETSLLLADGGPAPWDKISALWTIDKTFSVCLHSKTDYANRIGDGGASKHSVIKMIAVGPSAAPLADRTDECIAASFIRDFTDMFPEAYGKARAHAVRRYMHGVATPTLGFEEHVPELLKPVGNVHFAGDWVGFVDGSNPGGLGTDGDWGAYLVTSGLNSAVRAGMRAAREVHSRVTRIDRADAGR